MIRCTKLTILLEIFPWDPIKMTFVSICPKPFFFLPVRHRSYCHIPFFLILLIKITTIRSLRFPNSFTHFYPSYKGYSFIHSISTLFTSRLPLVSSIKQTRKILFRFLFLQFPTLLFSSSFSSVHCTLSLGLNNLYTFFSSSTLLNYTQHTRQNTTTSIHKKLQDLCKLFSSFLFSFLILSLLLILLLFFRGLANHHAMPSYKTVGKVCMVFSETCHNKTAMLPLYSVDILDKLSPFHSFFLYTFSSSA